MSPPPAGSASAKPLPAVQLPGRLKRGPRPGVVVLAGAEAWFRSQGVEAVLKSVLPEGDPGGAVVRLDGRQPEHKEQVLGAPEELRSASLFASEKVVIVENPEAVPSGSRAATLTQIVKAALAEPVAGSVLVCSTSQGVKGRGSVSASALLKAGALLVDCRALYDAPAPWERGPPYDHELARFAVQRLKQVHGKTLDLETAHMLTLRVGNDLAALDDTLRSLALLVGTRTGVTAEDVSEGVGETREDPIWTLVDAVLDQQVDKALTLVRAAFERGLTDQRGSVVVRPEALHAIITAALHAAWRRVLAGSEALARGEAGSEIAKAQGVPPFLADRFLARCRRDPAEVLRRHRAFLEAEMGARGGGVPPRLACERLVLALVAGQPIGARPSP
jgi:DNA polymerase III delta subunit